MKNKLIYYLTKNDPEIMCIGGPYHDYHGHLCEGTMAIRRKQFEKGQVTYLCLTEMSNEDGKTTITILEEYHKPPVEVLELNVAAKKKPATAKKIVIKKPPIKVLDVADQALDDWIHPMKVFEGT
jgi:hypothetical protein